MVRAQGDLHRALPRNDSGPGSRQGVDSPAHPHAEVDEGLGRDHICPSGAEAQRAAAKADDEEGRPALHRTWTSRWSRSCRIFTISAEEVGRVDSACITRFVAEPAKARSTRSRTS